MLKILDEQRGFSEKYVFPLMSKNEPANNSVIYAMLRKTQFGISSHDIRRTGADILEGMKDVSLDDVSLILDHSVQGADSNYVRKNKDKIVIRKQGILNIWHEYLAQMSGDNILSLKAVNS